ncbi:DUF445 domain-containing protein [Chrysiogenes arsenatis]|uniref:DUF445 domain-containing protein n=1 Tax=Chrysiogenes arsenatis TaxID=309797 RepID=UPI0003F5E3ED|nr:DUF445 family protein [Chrysiogenes arsenatis]
MELKLLLMPLIGLFIGWGTNVLAVKMLFRPHRPLHILGINFQGILPKRRTEIARKIAETVQDELLSIHEITRIFERFDIKEHIDTAIEELVRNKLKNRILEKIPMLAPMVESLLPKIQPAIVEELYLQAVQIKKAMIEQIHDEVDIAEIVVEKLDLYDLNEFESLILKVAQKELRHIEVLGAVLGFAIGSIQALIIYYL